MNEHRIGRTSAVVVSGLALAMVSWPALAVMPAGRPAAQAPFREGELVVRWRDATAAKSASTTMGLREKAVLDDRGSGRTTLMSLPSPTAVAGALATLQADPRVVWAEPNYLRRKRAVTPNDPSFPDQWGLYNTGQANFVAGGAAGTPGGDLNLRNAWDLDGDGVADHTGRGTVTVAIVDDAVETSHPDLAANLVAGYNFVRDTPDPNPVGNDETHGTEVAGCVAAVGNNGVGVSGVAWNEKLMPLKFGYDTASEVRALAFARDNGASIVNASFGGPGYSQAEMDAIADLGAHDILFVTSGGNEDANVDLAGASYPPNYDLANIVGVAATNRQDDIASFSSYGPTTMPVAAPGLQIVTTATGGGYTTNPGVTGTSFASPYVAGVAALLRDYLGGTAVETKARLIESASAGVDAASPVNLRTAGGRADAANALSIAARPALVIRPQSVGTYSQNYDGQQTVPIRVAAVVDDGGNGALDPGETATLRLVVGNLWQAAANVSGTLTADHGVSVGGGAVSLGSIASGGTAAASFPVTVPASLSGHQSIGFTLSLTADGGYSASRHFMLETGTLQPGVAVSQAIGTSLYDEFHTWHVDVTSVPADNQLVFTTSAGNDIDILVRYAAPAQYDISLGTDARDPDALFYANIPDAQVGGGATGNEKVTIDQPQVGTYYVTVVDYDRANASYTLKAALQKRALPSGGGGAFGALALLVLALAGGVSRGLRHRRRAALPSTRKAC